MMVATGLCMLSDVGGDLTWNLAIGGLLILGLIVGATVVIPWVRRRFDPSGQDESAKGVFAIERLEAMRGAGEITAEEFRLLRRSALGLDGISGKGDNSASSAPPGGDDDEGATRADGPCAGRDPLEE